MIEIGKKFGGGRGLRHRRWGVWSGVFPSPVWVGYGEGAVPPPQKIYEIFAWKSENGAFWLHFFVIRDIFSQFKGGGAWPNGKYAIAAHLETGTRTDLHQ